MTHLIPPPAVLGIGLFVLMGSPSIGDSPPNLLPNGSFTESREGRPITWRPQRWAGQGEADYVQAGRNGGYCVQVVSETGADMAWAAIVEVKPNARYRLQGWIRTEGVEGARGALLNLHGMEAAASAPVTGTQDWTRVAVEFDTDDQDVVQVNCLFGGWGQSWGAAWFDDLSLTLIGQREPESPGITVRAREIGEPMSELVYGQFIEHLGRCIYGGIWAEMLEDRKFYFPITDAYNPYRKLKNTPYPVVGASPWEVQGGGESLAMATEGSFVGEHTPRIGEGVAIRQLDLGVTEGKSYEGYTWVKAAGGGRTEMDVVLGWGEGESDRRVTTLHPAPGDYVRVPFQFTAGATTDEAWFEIRVNRGAALVGTVSLMPADNVEGLRADTLALLRELDSPIYRWPGGNFVSGYDWRDGVGDRDRRPPRTNPAWTGMEHNDFGMHEFVRFCELVDAEPWITVNTGFGDAYSAAAQLEYCNGAPDTLYGGQRATHGHPESFAIRYWGVGNEMWGDWQLGYMKLDHYVLKQNWVVEKMLEVDPDIICISSGNAGSWSTGLLKGSPDHMDHIAEHFYCQERPSLAAHVRQIPDQIRRKADFHRNAREELPELEGHDIRISMTEWNYWYGPHMFGELGTRYFLKDALGIAAGLHEYARQSDIVHSAFYAQTVNVIGCIKTSRRNAAFETTGLVLKLYRQHFGSIPVDTETTGTLDAQAAWTEDRSALTLGVVNPTQEPVTLTLQVEGARLEGSGTRFSIHGTDPQAFNDPDTPPAVTILDTPLQNVRDSVTVEPCSISLFVLPAE